MQAGLHDEFEDAAAIADLQTGYRLAEHCVRSLSGDRNPSLGSGLEVPDASSLQLTRPVTASQELSPQELCPSAGHGLRVCMPRSQSSVCLPACLFGGLAWRFLGLFAAKAASKNEGGGVCGGFLGRSLIPPCSIPSLFLALLSEAGMYALSTGIFFVCRDRRGLNADWFRSMTLLWSLRSHEGSTADTELETQ